MQYRFNVSYMCYYMRKWTNLVDQHFNVVEYSAFFELRHRNELGAIVDEQLTVFARILEHQSEQRGYFFRLQNGTQKVLCSGLRTHSFRGHFIRLLAVTMTTDLSNTLQ